MANPNRSSAARPTRIGVHAIRADLLFRYALERHDQIHTLADVRRLCSAWSSVSFNNAVARNVALGRFTEDHAGRLIVAEPDERA